MAAAAPPAPRCKGCWRSVRRLCRPGRSEAPPCRGVRGFGGACVGCAGRKWHRGRVQGVLAKFASAVSARRSEVAPCEGVRGFGGACVGCAGRKWHRGRVQGVLAKFASAAPAGPVGSATVRGCKGFWRNLCRPRRPGGRKWHRARVHGVLLALSPGPAESCVGARLPASSSARTPMSVGGYSWSRVAASSVRVRMIIVLSSRRFARAAAQ